MSDSDRRRPTPEQLLRRVEAEEEFERRGRLKVFLGYASGVGKSFRMLDEGRRRKLRGQDVVVGAVQPSLDESVGELLSNLESVPTHRNGSLDVDAIRQRRPSVCLIDGLAYRNPPGSRNEQRWQDVEGLLTSGISVITTINLQYIAEKQQRVELIRGKRVNDSVPERFLLRADDIEVVDAPALDPQLSELREIALVLAAEVVDSQLVEYLKRHGIDQTFGAHERILVCITPRSNAELMIGRGRRQADRFHGDLFVVYVEQPGLSEADRLMLERNLATARAVDARIEVLHGEDAVNAILVFARREAITQIFVGHSQRSGFWTQFRPNPVERLILDSGAIDIRVFPQGEADQEKIR
jgi:two-component system sensor histidine kinase KdpD